MIERREQPDLDFVINLADHHLCRIKYLRGLDYDFRESHVYDKNGKRDLTRPAYVLTLFYGDDAILEIYYELDSRFGLELKTEEMHRIETLLAERCIAAITTNGIVSLHNFMQVRGVIPNSIIKETEDKGFINLN